MGNEVPEGILEEVVALNQIFQNEDELAREGDGGRVGPFTAEITAYGKVKNIPSRWNLDLGGFRSRWRVRNSRNIHLQVFENWKP